MNTEKLQTAAAEFLHEYPGGFENAYFDAINKKHQMARRVAQARDSFAKKEFAHPTAVVASMAKLVGQSSLVSLFEKPKFRDTARDLGDIEAKVLANGLKQLLHGNQAKGFTTVVKVLQAHKLAKWSLVTVIPAYYAADDEVFIKPTTAKGVIEHFELEGLTYKPAPTWEFYERYREAILAMKSKVDPSLSPNNATFCGFLTMSMGLHQS